jgi:hypothetical protein
MRILRAIAVCAIAVLAFALAGCGGGSGSSRSSDQIALAADKTSKAGSIEADFTVSGGGVNGHGTGVFNTGDKGSGQLTVTVNVSGREFKIDTVITGTVLYMRSPAFQQLTGGKQWVKLDLGKIAAQRGIDLGSLLNTSPTPTSALAYLGGSAGKVKKVGTEKVQGVDTTHYRVTVDLERAAKHAKGTARQSLRRLIQTSGVKKVPEEVWIDDKGYVRKVVYETAGSGGGQKASVTMVLHDFGAHVPIQPPPKSSVVDIMSRLPGA